MDLGVASVLNMSLFPFCVIQITFRCQLRVWTISQPWSAFARWIFDPARRKFYYEVNTEIIFFPETFVLTYQTTRCCNQKDHNADGETSRHSWTSSSWTITKTPKPGEPTVRHFVDRCLHLQRRPSPRNWRVQFVARYVGKEKYSCFGVRTVE
jgi:hypothetical protein